MPALNLWWDQGLTPQSSPLHAAGACSILCVIHQSKNCRNLNMDVYENRETQFDRSTPWKKRHGPVYPLVGSLLVKIHTHVESRRPMQSNLREDFPAPTNCFHFHDLAWRCLTLPRYSWVKSKIQRKHVFPIPKFTPP